MHLCILSGLPADLVTRRMVLNRSSNLYDMVFEEAKANGTLSNPADPNVCVWLCLRLLILQKCWHWHSAFALAFGIWCLALGVWHLAFGIWHLAFGIWYSHCAAFDIRHSVFALVVFPLFALLPSNQLYSEEDVDAKWTPERGGERRPLVACAEFLVPSF